MKRILIIIAAILGMTIGGAALAAYMGGGDTAADDLPTDAATSPLTVAPDPEPDAWNGRGVQEINTTFMVGPHQIIIERFVYAGLDKERASVGVDAVVITPATKPKWLDGAWVMNSATNRWQPKSMKVRTTGKRHRLALRFTDLPVKRLRGSMAFSVTYPSGDGERHSFSIAPLAPSAPALVAIPSASEATDQTPAEVVPEG